MIFIGLFLFIASIVIALNLYNQSNLNKIEEYLQKNNCQNIIYSNGSYKALCEDYFIVVENSFSLDINKNSKLINYTDIKNLEVNKSDIIVNGDYKIKFKTEKKFRFIF
ncbi:MAG: hypothetical protein U5K55_04625 [Aliarcobacter sp.]|nr:hypothetical protein [Aliarcobacter sp.]